MTSLAERDFFLSPAFCAHNGVIVLSSAENAVNLGLTDPEDAVLRRRIESAWPEIDFRFSALDRESFTLALSRLYALMGGGDGLSGESLSSAELSIDQVESDAPIVNLLNSILLEAGALKASDIHIEAEAGNWVVRFRIDGKLRVITALSHKRAASLSARIKHLSNLNIIETRRPQDGRMNISTQDRTMDVRVSIVPTVKGESIALRLLNIEDSPLSLDGLGFSSGELERIRNAIDCRSGLILVSGPTGSGKTTTLSSILRELKSPELKIVSIEDPVEYRLDNVTQIQTDDALDLSFESLMRHIFRQDPDIVMLGEIRDPETARLAVRAALTGHLVFATLHATGALETLPRLLNLGVEPYMIAGVLRLSLAQRLVRRVCRNCGGEGCSSCGNTGYAGRIVISESVAMTPALRDCLETGYSASAAFAAADQTGLQTLREDGLEKAALGITDREEIFREAGR